VVSSTPRPLFTPGKDPVPIVQEAGWAAGPVWEEFQPWIIFQQGGTPPYWGSHVRRFFGCSISKQVDWERWSVTLATTIAGYHPLDFFLWGYVKDKVFSTPVPDITNLKARITGAFATLTLDMLENTWREIDYRVDVLRATKGAHVEVYWCVVKNFLSWVTFWEKTSWFELHFGKKNFLSWVTFWGKNFLGWVTFWGKNFLSWVTFWEKKTSWVELHFGKKLLGLSYILKKNMCLYST